MDRPQLTDDRWQIIQPLLPASDLDRTSNLHQLPDRCVFAVLSIVLLGDHPWKIGMRYEVSGTTLRYRWQHWRASGVFTRIQTEVTSLTDAGRWAWRIAATSDARARRIRQRAESAAANLKARAEQPAEGRPAPARHGEPTLDDYRRAWVAQNAFPG